MGHIRPLNLESAPEEWPPLSVTDVVREFSPNWFTVTMGTGAVALALNQMPYPFLGAHELAGGLWLLDMILFGLFTFLYTARWIFFFHEACRIFSHPVASMFLGAIPMGLATIVNGLLVFGLPLWGESVVCLAHFLWWIDVVMSAASGLLVPFLMFTLQQHSVDRMTAVWLVPVVAAEVSAASGALLLPYLPTWESFAVLVLSYSLWAFSVPLAMSLVVILLLRLVLYKLPEREMAGSGWLALGPIGTGALGLLLLGADAPRVFGAIHLPAVGEVAFGVGIIGGTMLWGYGAWWLLLAILKTGFYIRKGMPFNLGWWGFIFPLGVYALATIDLANATHLTFLFVIGELLVVCLAGVWLIVTAITIDSAWCGDLFVPGAAIRSIPSRHGVETINTSSCDHRASCDDVSAAQRDRMLLA
jgi:C4-dicarboxylate transporter/malic acid transport protein